MNNQPFSVHMPEQKCLIAAIVYHPLVTLYRRFDFDIGDGPREIALEMSFDIRKIQLKAIESVTFGFHMMFDQVCEALILPARFNVTRTFEVQKMLPKRLPVCLFPALFHRIDNRDKRR